MQKTKNKYITANLHQLNSKTDSRFSQIFRMGFLQEINNSLKLLFIFVKGPSLDIWVPLILNLAYTQKWEWGKLEKLYQIS